MCRPSPSAHGPQGRGGKPPSRLETVSDISGRGASVPDAQAQHSFLPLRLPSGSVIKGKSDPSKKGIQWEVANKWRR